MYECMHVCMYTYIPSLKHWYIHISFMYVCMYECMYAWVRWCFVAYTIVACNYVACISRQLPQSNICGRV